MYMNNISKFWCDWTTIFENWKSSTDPHMEFYASNNLHTKRNFSLNYQTTVISDIKIKSQ